MAKQTITANERLQLIGLLALAKMHNDKLRDIEAASIELTGDAEMGHTYDGIYSDYSADEILSRLNITVEPTQAVAAVDPVGEKVTG